MGKKNTIPDRWDAYKPYGTSVPNTPFIPFKVPLKDAISRNVPHHLRFTPEMLANNVSNLGLIIDLTNTQRYYDPQEFLQRGIQYEKIFCPGGGSIPSEHIVHQFNCIVMSFVASHDMSGKYIGVHCTHGINRTGYLICRYMIDHLGIAPEEAVRAFHKGRGYPIERQEYTQHLLAGTIQPRIHHMRPPRNSPNMITNGRHAAAAPRQSGHGNKPAPWNSRSAASATHHGSSPVQTVYNPAPYRNYYSHLSAANGGSFAKPKSPDIASVPAPHYRMREDGRSPPIGGQRSVPPLRRVQSAYFLCTDRFGHQKHHAGPKAKDAVLDGWDPRFCSPAPQIQNGFPFYSDGFAIEQDANCTLNRSLQPISGWCCQGRAQSFPNLY